MRSNYLTKIVFYFIIKLHWCFIFYKQVCSEDSQSQSQDLMRRYCLKNCSLLSGLMKKFSWWKPIYIADIIWMATFFSCCIFRAKVVKLFLSITKISSTNMLQNSMTVRFKWPGVRWSVFYFHGFVALLKHHPRNLKSFLYLIDYQHIACQSSQLAPSISVTRAELLGFCKSSRELSYRIGLCWNHEGFLWRELRVISRIIIFNVNKHKIFV